MEREGDLFLRQLFLRTSVALRHGKHVDDVGARRFFFSFETHQIFMRDVKNNVDYDS